MHPCMSIKEAHANHFIYKFIFEKKDIGNQNIRQ